MQRRISAVLTALAAITCGFGVARAGKPSGTVNVTTVVHDFDASGAQLLVRSDDYNGTGQGIYSAALDANLQSYIDSNGAWYLRLYSQSVRTLYITPNDAINSLQPPGPPPAYYWQDVEVAAGCYDQNLNVVPLQNIVTSSNNCKLITDFSYNGTQYKMVMGPVAAVNGPATGVVTITCNSVNNGRCVNWTITPDTSPGAPNPTIADLFGALKPSQFGLDWPVLLQVSD